MGTSGAYSGSGGKDGKAIRDAIGDYLSDLAGDHDDRKSSGERSPLDPNDLRRIINLIRPHPASGGGSDGPSGGSGSASRDRGTGERGGGGPQRSAAASARTAGRAAAAAYAYRAGDAATLQRLGLDYNELCGLGDEFEVLRRIVDMACSVPDSTIEDHEQRRVAAEVAEWVMEQERDGIPPSPVEIVRQTIATIIAEALLVESGDQVNSSSHAYITESDIRDAAEAIAAQATLSVDGTSEDELGNAIEAGIETLRHIVGGTG
ncbi:hypothetical protein Afil01_27550 [Actinorhabdospora filicis]|uniref:Uncharacterized protein n=1 Tax=Actinorhabdospora filicis TaxID=1785913 RepID=A0A9W6W9F7_9ACTN|nr:hypothetical protein [Actinorhabdospora filicis]GLZ77948.1 hypothetical protein Afil01_27550 [Actinorhabdospora filicis]